jgi:hypothetical protein
MTDDDAFITLCFIVRYVSIYRNYVSLSVICHCILCMGMQVSSRGRGLSITHSEGATRGSPCWSSMRRPESLMSFTMPPVPCD